MLDPLQPGIGQSLAPPGFCQPAAAGMSYAPPRTSGGRGFGYALVWSHWRRSLPFFSPELNRAGAVVPVVRSHCTAFGWGGLAACRAACGLVWFRTNIKYGMQAAMGTIAYRNESGNAQEAHPDRPAILNPQPYLELSQTDTTPRAPAKVVTFRPRAAGHVICKAANEQVARALQAQGALALVGTRMTESLA